MKATEPTDQENKKGQEAYKNDRSPKRNDNTNVVICCRLKNPSKQISKYLIEDHHFEAYHGGKTRAT